MFLFFFLHLPPLFMCLLLKEGVYFLFFFFFFFVFHLFALRSLCIFVCYFSRLPDMLYSINKFFPSPVSYLFIYFFAKYQTFMELFISSAIFLPRFLTFFLLIFFFFFFFFNSNFFQLLYALCECFFNFFWIIFFLICKVYIVYVLNFFFILYCYEVYLIYCISFFVFEGIYDIYAISFYRYN